MTKKIQLIFSIMLAAMSQAYAQQLSDPVQVCSFNTTLEENSGLVWLDGKLWTHNDSGNSNELFQIDTSDCSVSRIVQISNAVNTDWEDICADENHVYIGDFGNNNGDRTDLCIYKVSRDFVNQAEIEDINADSITFHYPNQEQFEWDDYSTNFDCEAMIADGDSLYLFSKNWGNLKTYLYALPKTPGDYPAVLLDSFNAEGLITGASADTAENKLFILGYNEYMTSSFVFFINDYPGHNYFDSNIQKFTLGFIFHQTEGIAVKNDEIMISHESFQSVGAGLHRTFLDENTGFSPLARSENPYFYPNPVNQTLHLENCDNFNQLFIKNVEGSLLLEKRLQQDSLSISINNLTPGTYILELRGNKNDFTDILIVE